MLEIRKSWGMRRTRGCGGGGGGGEVPLRREGENKTQQFLKFDVWLTVHRSSMWNKRPTKCRLVLYLFLLYRLLNMFRASLYPSSGADALVVFFRCVAVL